MSAPETGEVRFGHDRDRVFALSSGDLRAGTHHVIFFTLIPLTALWLYRRALSFAYFNDDPTGHFAWMESRTVTDFFASSADYGYYRPVVFAALRLWQTLFGTATLPHNPVADHALLWLLHAANTSLVWALTRRLSGRAAYAWAAALIFAFVPFSYEAVAYVASLTHPLMVFWTLLALLSYERRRRVRERERASGAGDRRPQASRYFLLALLALSLGLLTHENGLFIFPALVGLEWVIRPDASWRVRARALWPFAIPPVAFVILWLVIPKSSEQGLNTLADIGRNTVPFLQTLVYPLLPLMRFEAGDIGSLTVVASSFVVVFGLLARGAGAGRLWVFAIGWFALSSLPALLFLGPAYVYGSPRLGYLPSVGVAMLWGLPVLSLWAGSRQALPGSGRPIAARLVLVAALTLAVILPPLPFIGCQLDFYAETSRFARAMAATGDIAPPGHEVVFVNAPFFFSSTANRPEGCPSPYPWTTVGGILIPPYAQPRDFVRFNGGPDRPAAGVTFPGYAPGWRTFGPAIDGEALRDYAVEESPFVFDLLRGEFADLSGVWQPGAAGPGSTLVTFGDTLALGGASLNDTMDGVLVELTWRVLEPPGVPLSAFVHVYNTGGALVAQHDGPPGGGLAPQDLWRTGDGLSDRRWIDLSPLPPGRYVVSTGLYSTTDGKRLAAAAGDQLLDNDMYVLGFVEK